MSAVGSVTVHVSYEDGLAVGNAPQLRLAFDDFVLWEEVVRNCCVNSRLMRDPEDVAGVARDAGTGEWSVIAPTQSLGEVARAHSDGSTCIDLELRVKVKM